MTLRISGRKFSYSKAVDPGVNDLPHTEHAEWRNSVSGAWFDWDNFNRVWLARASGALSHARQHAITSAADHTSAATIHHLLKADVNGLPVESTALTEVSDSLYLTKNRDGTTLIQVENTNAGTGAVAQLSLTSGVSKAFAFQKYGAGYSTLWNGMSIADWAMWRSDSLVKGFIITTGGSKPIVFGINDVEVARITATIMSLVGTMKLQFRDSAIYAWSGTDGWLNLVADTGVEVNAPILNTAITYAATRIETPQIKTDIAAPTDLTITTGAAKTLVLATPVYKDIHMAGMLLSKPAVSAPGVDNFRDSTGTDTTIVTLAFAEDEYVSGGFELQHDYAEGTDLVFHVHWQGIAAPSGTDNVQWRLTYVMCRDGVTLAAATTIDSPDTAIDTRYRCYRNDFAAIAGATFKIGDQIMFNLYRVAATGDAYAGDALIQTAGIHYQVTRLGSRNITTV